MTSTQIYNHLWYMICLIVAVYAAIPSGALQVLPPEWRAIAAGVAAVAAWIKANKNLFINPDGTNAQAAWTPPAPK